jgi:hypothetical protein
MTDRKKTGAALWATAEVVVVLMYPISFGPACGVSARTGTDGGIVRVIYHPVVAAAGATGIAEPYSWLVWYMNLGVPGNVELSVSSDAEIWQLTQYPDFAQGERL